jgi:recA bacterial DNA recombination protein
MASIVPEEKVPLKERLKTLDSISSQMNKKFGKVVMGRIGDNPEIMERLKIKFIPTPSLELNEATGGGFPRRRCSIVTGKEDSGKTSLVLETIAKNQKEDPNFVAGWLETENSLEEDYIVNTFGIDPERFFLIPLDTELGAEKTLDIVQSILAAGSLDLFCINSLKCLIPEKEMEASLTESQMALSARLNSKVSRKFNAIIAQNDIAFIMINHLTTEIGSMSRENLAMSGGLAIRYWSHLTLDLRRNAIMAGEPIGSEEGVKIAVKIKKNHCIPSRFPYARVTYYAIFGEGIEQYLSALDLGEKAGIIQKGGAWIYWREGDKELGKFNGKAAYREYMKEHPDVFQKFLAHIKGEGIEVEKLSEDEVKEIQSEEKLLEENIKVDKNELDKDVEELFESGTKKKPKKK